MHHLIVPIPVQIAYSIDSVVWAALVAGTVSYLCKNTSIVTRLRTAFVSAIVGGSAVTYWRSTASARAG